MRHEDDRRLFKDFGAGFEWKICGVVKMKKTTSLGEHCHRFCNKAFMLVHGSGNITRNGKCETMEREKEYLVPKDTLYEFELNKGAILVSMSDKLYDPNDDHASKR